MPIIRFGKSARRKTVMLNSLDLEGSPRDVRVVVAMSGGVDSSVTAALLKAEGYDVAGVTLQLYDHGAATHRKGACCAGQDVYDARAVAERRSEEHTSELQSRQYLVCRLLLEKKKQRAMACQL